MLIGSGTTSSLSCNVSPYGRSPEVNSGDVTWLMVCVTCTFYQTMAWFLFPFCTFTPVALWTVQESLRSCMVNCSLQSEAWNGRNCWLTNAVLHSCSSGGWECGYVDRADRQVNLFFGFVMELWNILLKTRKIYQEICSQRFWNGLSCRCRGWSHAVVVFCLLEHLAFLASSNWKLSSSLSITDRYYVADSKCFLISRIYYSF